MQQQHFINSRSVALCPKFCSTNTTTSWKHYIENIHMKILSTLSNGYSTRENGTLLFAHFQIIMFVEHFNLLNYEQRIYFKVFSSPRLNTWYKIHIEIWWGWAKSEARRWKLHCVFDKSVFKSNFLTFEFIALRIPYKDFGVEQRKPTESAHFIVNLIFDIKKGGKISLKWCMYNELFSSVPKISSLILLFNFQYV